MVSTHDPIRARKFTVLTALVAVFALSLSALAAVAFDPETGEGFVGKGDVQIVFGWNNKQLQSNATGVQFRYTVSETVEQDCVSASGIPPTFTVVGQRTKTEGVNTEVEYDKRRNKNDNVTGFILTGFGDEEVLGGGFNACPTGSTPMGAVRVLDSTGGVLEAGFGGVWHVIWNAPEESLNAFQTECLAQGGTNEDPVVVDHFGTQDALEYSCTGLGVIPEEGWSASFEAFYEACQASGGFHLVQNFETGIARCRVPYPT